MSTVQEIEAAIQRLPSNEVATLHDWLEDFYEEQLELSDETKASLDRAKKDLEEGHCRIRQTPS